MEKPRNQDPRPEPADRDDIRFARNRCPYCHDDIATQADDWVACKDCLARHHEACWDESGRCGSCGSEARLAEEEAPPATATQAANPNSPLGLRLTLVLAVLATMVTLIGGVVFIMLNDAGDFRDAPSPPQVSEAYGGAPQAANLAWDRGDYQAAFELYDAEVRREPGSARPVAQRAWCRIALEQFDEALVDFDRALELEPSAFAYEGRALAKALAGDQAGASSDLRVCVALNPDTARARFWLAAMTGDTSFVEHFAGESSSSAEAWNTTLAAMLLGRIDPQELLLAATRSDPSEVVRRDEAGTIVLGGSGSLSHQERARRIAQANLYLGLQADRLQQPTQAAEHYRAVLASKAHADTAAQVWALVRLRQLERSPAPAGE
jgi:tetratricopeptide (TPR) repeat protein